MAEVLGVIASGISVVQIAGQLVKCVNQLHSICRSIRDFPSELQLVLNDIEILGELLQELYNTEETSIHPGGSSLLRASLAHCEAAASSLELVVARTNNRISQSNAKLSWKMIKGLWKKNEIANLKQRLNDAKLLLHLAMTSRSLFTQKQHTAILENCRSELLSLSSAWNGLSVHQSVFASLTEPPSVSPHEGTALSTRDLQLVPKISNVQKASVSRSTCFLKKCSCACHSPKTIRGNLWHLEYPKDSTSNSCTRQSCSKYRRASLWVGLSMLGIPFAVRLTLDFILSSGYTYISPSLQVKRLVDWDSPAFEVLGHMRWEEQKFEDGRDQLLRLFESGKASPLDILPDGTTMLEKILRLPWPNGGTQVRLLEMLVHMGAPLNTTSMIYICARWNGFGNWRTGLDDTSAAHRHLLSTILRLGFDPSEIDALSLEQWPEEHSPKLEGRYQDPFFIEWMSELVRVLPDFGSTSPLLAAILIESEDEVKNILRHGPINNDENVLGQSALHIAVSRPQHLNRLLEAGFDVNARDWNGRTPLMYAAVAGCSDVAIELLKGGADIWMKDILFCAQDFIQYAVFEDNWPLIMDVVDFFCHHPAFSPVEKQALLDQCIILWAGSACKTRNSRHFSSLLQWGANPEIRFNDCGWEWRPETSSNTLLHLLSKASDIDDLVKSGFASFNHCNSSGASPLMVITELRNTALIQKCLAIGCEVNVQDIGGRTALHTCIETMWDLWVDLHMCYQDYRLTSLECAQLLLDNGSDPDLGDSCRCACSPSGYTPGNILLKERRYISEITQTYPPSQYTWSLEYLRVLRLTKGTGLARSYLLDLIRLVKFEELGLTHTCCRKNQSRAPWVNIEPEDVQEIQDEESEIINQLNSQMEGVGKIMDADLYDVWMDQLAILLKIRAAGSWRCPEETRHDARKHFSQLRFFSLRDRFKMADIDDYAGWAYRRRLEDVERYELRMRWISKFRNILEGGVYKPVELQEYTHLHIQTSY